jgi:inner membrane protein
MGLFSVWWAWVAGGFALGVLEVLAPGYIFLGFAIGAVLTGMLVGVGILGESLPILLLTFALMSLAAWLGTRKLLGRQASIPKVWDKDINDN